MSYLGKVELKASDIRAIAPGTATAAQTDIVLSWLAPNVQSLIVTINGVKQETDSYTITGTASSTVVLGVGMTLSDTYQVIGINDVGTTIVPADGTVTLPKLSAGTGTTGQYLKTDGCATLSWSTVSAVEDVFWENAQTISSDYTITASKNAMTAGDITVNSGITVTVPVGASWVIL